MMNVRSHSRRRKETKFWHFWTPLMVIVLDQITKSLVCKYVFSISPVYEVTSFLNFTYTRNHGVSFGWFGEMLSPNILSIITAGVILSLFVYAYTIKEKSTAIAYGMIVGGGLGNLIDRVRFGGVVDFIDFHLLGYHPFIFNIADCAITFGAIILLWEGLISKKSI